MTKTFEQIIQEYGDYNVFANIVDPLTQLAIEKKFRYRHVCDTDPRFITMFQRNLELYKWQYDNKLAVESKAAELDPLDLIDKTTSSSGRNQYLKGGKISITDTITKAITEQETLDKDTRLQGTDTRQEQLTGSSSYSDENDNTRTTSMTDSSTSETKDRGLRSDTPQANVSPNTSGDLDDPILWNYATELNDGITKNTGSTATNGTVSDDGSSSGSAQNTTNTTGTLSKDDIGTEDSTRDKTVSETESASKVQNNELEDTDILSGEQSFTGRDGELLSTILGEWRNFITQTNALKWLFGQLETCFMSSLLYGEDEIEF